ncbi:Putative transposase of IS4/5 family [Streptomyces sp. 2131.1]|nr:Putative transposase of IS4/5 family [Streptomyces sp. 2131.1]
MVGRVSGVRADLVPDDLWERVAPLLPPAPERRHRHPGRLRVPDRVALAGVLYVLRTGVAWRDVPAEAVGCSGVTAWRRLRDWTEAGVWPRLHAALLMRSALAEVGLAVAGRAGARLADVFGAKASRTTVLRLVDALPEPPPADPAGGRRR